MSKELKKLLLAVGIVLLLFATGFNLLSLMAYQKMSNEYYRALSVLLEEVKGQYPEFEEKDWISYLETSRNQEAAEANAVSDDEQLLLKYGYFQDEMVLESQRKQFTSLVIVSNLLFILTAILCGFCVFLYWSRREKSIDELAEYVKKVEQGEYALDLMENTEDELSRLKNELYTVTVMLKENAEISKKQKKALASGVSDISHQIKTPLTSVMVLLDNLTEDEDMPSEVRRTFLTEATRQCNHVSWLVANLLKLSRLDAGVVEFIREEHNIQDIILDVKEKLEILSELKQVQIVTDGEDVVECVDRHWFTEALINIVKNGIEHSPEKSDVFIRLCKNDVYTSILVEDFGEGMDEEDCKHIFERFYRSKHAGEQSIGIGLALAKEVVIQHGGTISVNSKLGVGTKFEIKLYHV